MKGEKGGRKNNDSSYDGERKRNFYLAFPVPSIRRQARGKERKLYFLPLREKGGGKTGKTAFFEGEKEKKKTISAVAETILYHHQGRKRNHIPRR